MNIIQELLRLYLLYIKIHSAPDQFAVIGVHLQGMRAPTRGCASDGLTGPTRGAQLLLILYKKDSSFFFSLADTVRTLL